MTRSLSNFTIIRGWGRSGWELLGTLWAATLLGVTLSSDSILGMTSTVGAGGTLWFRCRNSRGTELLPGPGRGRTPRRPAPAEPLACHHHHPHVLSLPPRPPAAPGSKSVSPTLGWGRHCLADPIHSIWTWGNLQRSLVPGRVMVPLSQVFSCLILLCDYCSCF